MKSLPEFMDEASAKVPVHDGVAHQALLLMVMFKPVIGRIVDWKALSSICWPDVA
ncbi:hypothetical protein HDG34_005022 [Paraburkholderia sp. HC6.4b]|uniref:hypothetical protein n=1 Tax=unclassified Paraburkholderia TaxID=2615204 RepID=UPI00161FD991|nr:MULTISPECIES: hypothetical protein [unclassified Paraburkholderia]MBB5411062.1 hypothetical protein [Paraburkholderia sp. HC6.4b]MBB5453833.1 hypothetical protein [Paraburkholderia sp. Kb1A]